MRLRRVFVCMCVSLVLNLGVRKKIPFTNYGIKSYSKGEKDLLLPFGKWNIKLLQKYSKTNNCNLISLPCSFYTVWVTFCWSFGSGVSSWLPGKLFASEWKRLLEIMIQFRVNQTVSELFKWCQLKLQSLVPWVYFLKYQ